MKQTKNTSRKNNMLLFILVSICAIIFIVIRTIADDNLNMRQVRYQLGNMVNYEFSFYTDSPKFHTKASGYEKYKGMNTENNMNSIMATDMTKMQGYGNYEFKPDTNLFSFIDYCYSKEPAKVSDCAYRAGTTAENEWNYTKLMSYRDRSVNTNFFKRFWQNMSNQCSNFKDYQDDFFFLYYTYPATQKVGINLAMMRNLQNEGESVKEYLTCLTSYIFSITPQAQVNGMTFGKGDVVPFLYYKDRKHANIDVRNDSDSLMDIAKYAYVALIEGWCTLPTPYHLWENEYNWLFGNYEPENLDYDLETLHEWYDETYQRYCKDKGRKGNNLLGSDIEHIIESDYSIEQQLESTEYYIRGIFTDLGIETDYKETMARNELMVEYMMQNSNFDATIKDYNVTIEFMTENLQRGTQEEQNTHTVVTSDFQKLEFPYTMDKRNVNHSDEDGISDGAELGNEKWINITEFVRRTYEDVIRSGQPHKATFEAQVEDIIEKNGAYTDFNGNKVYGSVKWNDDKTKVLYRVYDYKSNPKLNDTDFDGIDDNYENEGKEIDNKFIGTSTEIGKVEYNQDFRWFYTNNQKYNDELAVMSLIMSNLADGNNVNTDQASGDIAVYLTSIGFGNIQNIGEYGDNIYIAKKTIQYYDQRKDVIGVFLGKCDRWYSEVIKYKENQKAQVINTVYRESLENYIIRIINKVNLIATSDCSYWVAGYDVGGSIASEISAKLVDTGKVVYCYTFGAFNTRDSLDTKNEIKNLRNEDDFAVKFITGTKPGQNYGASIFEDLMWEYRDLTGNSDYEGNYIFTNYLLYVYDKTEITGTENEETMLDIFDNYMLNFNKITNQDVINDFADLCMLMDKWADGNRKAHSIKSYYVLAKSLTGFDLLDGDELRQEHYKRKDEAMVVAFNGTENIMTDAQKEQIDSVCDGYPFNDLLEIEINYDYENENNERACKKIDNYMYTYYTINEDDAVENDINYVRFWNENYVKPTHKLQNGTEKVEKLYEYEAGDIGKNTKFTYSGYYDNKTKKYSTFLQIYKDLGGAFSKTTKIANNSNIVEIEGRIIAAFPPALFSEYVNNEQFEKSTKNMHKYSSYAYDRDNNNNNKLDAKHYDGASIVAKDKDIFKLVDVVMEYNDSAKKERYQFVVPFVMIDPKNIHLDFYNKSGTGKFANLTDNRYGQVEERYSQSDNNYRVDSDGNKILDKDVQKSCEYISPIEPYIKKGGDSKDLIHEDLIKIICGIDKIPNKNAANFRIVSMRLYNSDYAVAKHTKARKYKLNTKKWKDIRKNIGNYLEGNYTLEERINKLIESNNLIVKYE